MNAPSAYKRYVVGLQLGHAALLRNLDRFVDTGERGEAVPPETLADFVALYQRFLDLHHRSEDDFVFPALRRHTAGRSTDAAHLERWTSEHRDIHTLGAELGRVAARSHAVDDLRTLARSSQALRDLLAPHVAAEEEILSVEHLPQMIAERELDAAMRAIGRANRSEAMEMASFFAASLDPSEQQAVFGDAPWVFRKILALAGRRRMRRFRSLVRSTSIEL